MNSTPKTGGFLLSCLKKHFFEILLIFIVIFTIFFSLEFNSNNPYFSGYDSYYHIGMSEYIMKHGFPKKFPYLYFTTLNDSFSDNHLFFHLMMIPFILVFGDVVGPKILIALMVALIFVLMYIIFRRLDFKWALPWTALAFFLMPCDFYFRQAFIRNPAPSLFFLLLAFYFLLDKRYIALSITAFLYGWLYTGGGFLFLLAMLAIYAFASIIRDKKLSWKLVLFPTAATLLSLVINPYFPENVKSIFLQVWQTGLQAKQYSGGEWYPYDTWFWFSISYIPLAIWIGGTILAFYRKKRVSQSSLIIFIFATFLLVMQWKSKRFIEYWPFWAALSGITLGGKYVEDWMVQIQEEIKNRKIFSNIPKLALIILMIIGFAGFSFAYAKEQWNKAWNDTVSDFNVDSAREAHQYLIKNSSPGDIVFTDDWDVFPLNFYLNQKDYYIVGLDPEFMNQYDHKLYKEFADISSGSDSNNLERIRDTFKSKWVLVGADHLDFRDNLLANPKLFKEVFSNKEYYLFKVL